MTFRSSRAPTCGHTDIRVYVRKDPRNKGLKEHRCMVCYRAYMRERYQKRAKHPMGAVVVRELATKAWR